MEINQELEAAYRRMAQDEEREAEALEWAEATMLTPSEPVVRLHPV